MALANVEHRKTETRRIMDPQPPDSWGGTSEIHAALAACKWQPGDLIWQKETFFNAGPFKHTERFAALSGDFLYFADYAYRAKDRPSVIGEHHWTPSIFMPRKASRFESSIIRIRLQRLQEITEEEAMAEGVEPLIATANPPAWMSSAPPGIQVVTDRDFVAAYRDLWNHINLKPSPVHGPKGKTTGKREILHYTSCPWSMQDFEQRHPFAAESLVWKDKPLHIHPDPFVWVITYQPTPRP